jgi:iron complex outermembrane receptor protein
VQDAKFKYEQFSQELQMVGSTERLQYAVGLYYFEDEGKFDNYRLAAVPLAGDRKHRVRATTPRPKPSTRSSPTPPILDDRLAITLGYRFTEETKGVKYRYSDDGTASGTGLFSPTAAPD